MMDEDYAINLIEYEDIENEIKKELVFFDNMNYLYVNIEPISSRS